MAQPVLFSDSLNAIVEGVPVIADAFLVHNGGTEHIAALADLSANRVRKNPQHQMRGVDDIAILGFDFFWYRKASHPDRLNSSPPKNLLRIPLCCCQQFGGDM